MLYVIIILLVIAWAATIVYLTKTNQAETKDLHLRLASKSLEDYHYWRDAQPLEVEHNKQILEKIRKEPVKELTAEEIEKKKAAEQY